MLSRRPGARQILEDCWTPIRNVIEPRVADMLIAALGPIAKSDDEEAARKARLLLTRDRAFLHAYSEALRVEMVSSIGDFVAHRTPNRASGSRSLSLVEYDDMELNAFVESAGGRLLNGVGDLFTSVKLRILDLVRETALSDAEMPLRPAMFLRPLRVALEAVGTPHDDLLDVMRLFVAPLAVPVAAAFEAIDRYLASQGLSDEVVRNARHQRPSPSPAAGTFAPVSPVAPGMPAYAVPLAGGVGVPVPAGFGLPPQALAAIGADPMVAAGQMLQFMTQRIGGVVPGPAVAGVPGGGFAQPAVFGASGPFGGLGGVAHGSAAVDPRLIDKLGEIQRFGALAFAAHVGDGAGAGAGVGLAPAKARELLNRTATRQVDRLTIELVGLLFDRIARDRHIPRPIRDLLGALQFPVLRVALTDPDLFLTPEQPARRLLDRIASTAIGWTEDGDDNRRYLAEVRRAVQTVLTDTGPQSFGTAFEAFERYLDAERTRDDDPVSRAKRALERAENREIQVIRATMQVRSAFDGVQIESYLRDFLLDTWVRVLVAAAEREGAEPGIVRRFVSIVPDLVWTVQPKLAPNDRKRMLAAIPPVLSVLREGLKLIEWAPDRSSEFFSKLMKSHADAIKTIELAHGGGQRFEPSTMRIKLDAFSLSKAATTAVGTESAANVELTDDLIQQAFAADNVPISPLNLPAGMQPPSPGSGREASSLARGLKRGDWFELRIADGFERVQLRWVSPRRNLYVFTSKQGGTARSLTRDNLRSFLEAGWLRPLEEAPLFERAVAEVMGQLQQASAPNAHGAS